MVGLRPLGVVLLLLLVLVAQASAEGRGDARLAARSAAYGVKVLLPNEEPIVAGAVSGPPSRYGSPGAFMFPTDGSVVRIESVSGRATADAAGSHALAGADLRAVALFGGEVTADAVVARSLAFSAQDVGASRYGATQITNLVVLGQPIEPKPDLRVPIGDWGRLTLLQERERTAGSYHRGWVTVLDVRLEADHAGLPVGTRILVGYAEAAARVPAVAAAPVAHAQLLAVPQEQQPPVVAPRPRITRSLGLPAGSRRPGTVGPLPLVLVLPKVRSRLTKGGYVFPVYGAAGFGDSFGAPRADTVWHHGADIFAPLGAPVLAVANGTVYSVGRNELGGNRFWLRDDAGNEFYYAHLSAFSPSAVNGARVRAGDVIGFVGNTGDADGTPYHLHFEIHPASMLIHGEDGVIDPTSYLRAWQHLVDIALPTAAVWAPTVIATKNLPAAGAILLQSSDISTASGLDPGSLVRALAPPLRGDGMVAERAAHRLSAQRSTR